MGVGLPFQVDYQDDLTQSWIDALTNNVYLVWPDPSQLVKAFVSSKPLPFTGLNSFLHEATHHWCFLSLVGNCLAVANATSIQMALELQPLAEQLIKKELRLDVVPDEALQKARRNSQLLYSTAPTQKLLGPILEGLALFAELDANYRGRFNCIPDPFAWCDALFGANAAGSVNQADLRGDDRLSLLLYMLRFDDVCVERKADLFCQSYGGSEGTHLLGYCFIRCLYRHLTGVDSRLKDGLLFVAFVRAWFLEDPELGRFFLLPSRDPDHFQDSVASYLVRRIDEILKVNPSPLINVLRRSDDNHGNITAEALGKDEDTMKACKEELRRAFRGLGVDPENQEFVKDEFEPSGIDSILLARMLLRRSFFRVGGINVSISEKRVGDDIEVSCSAGQNQVLKFRIKMVPIPNRYEKIDDPGVVELFVRESDAQRYIVLSGYDEIVEVISLSDDAIRAKTDDFLRVTFANHKLTQAIRGFAESTRMFNQVFPGSINDERIAHDADPIIGTLYGGSARMFGGRETPSAETREAFEAALSENGLAGILTIELLRAFALWDTCEIHEIPMSARPDFFAKKSLDFTIVAKQLADAFSRFNITLGCEEALTGRGPRAWLQRLLART